MRVIANYDVLTTCSFSVALGTDMDFAETEEQSMIREMVRDFAEEVLAPTCLVRDSDQKPPLDEWKTFCEYGLQGITIPEEYGGTVSYTHLTLPTILLV